MGNVGFRVVRLSDRDGCQQWHDAVAELPTSLSDVHFTASYASVQQHLGVEPLLVVYEAYGYRVVQPLALRKVSIGGIEAMDVANLYGYGGPVASEHSQQLYNLFHQALMTWFRDIGVVSEFCALNPMLGKHQQRLVSNKIELVERKPVVVIDLQQAPRYGYRNRRRAGIKSALGLGVKVGPSNDFATFVKLYAEMMARKSASPRWFFPLEYLAVLCQIGMLFSATIDSVTESMALLLTSQSGDAYYHLAANALIHPKSGANDLLVHEMANHARAIGMKWLHLGGGVTSAPDDSVLMYKAGFSDMRLPTYSYFRVLDDRAYRNLCLAKIDQEIAETGAEFAGGFLPLYRREAS